MKIKHRSTNKILFSSDADLRGADLQDADLQEANLRNADLRNADLQEANLQGADLRNANLQEANLQGADLRNADLQEANLRDANLQGAYLIGAYLQGANLRGANLQVADLRGAEADLISELLKLPNELEFLKQALINGKVDGSTYEGECACLAGTLAHGRGFWDYKGGNINGFHSDPYSPRERFFLAIKKGDTPKTNPICKMALEWTEKAIMMRDHIRKTAILD